MTSSKLVALALALATVACGGRSSQPTPTPRGCVGDCNHDGQVTVEELLIGAQIAQRSAPVVLCPAADADGDGAVTVDEIITANRNAQTGCPQ